VPPTDEDLISARREASSIQTPWVKISLWPMVLPSDCSRESVSRCVYSEIEVSVIWKRGEERSKKKTPNKTPNAKLSSKSLLAIGSPGSALLGGASP